MTAPLDLDALKAKALAAGGDTWTTDAEDCGAVGTFQGHHVWRGDGDAVVRCFSNIGHMPDPIDDSDVSEYVAAASPAVMLDLLERLWTAEAEAVHYRGVANEVRKQQIGAAAIVDPTKGRYNCAGDYVMPKPFYDPSLQVPAEILDAVNMVSTWAAKQDRGSWRIGDVCSADFADKQNGLVEAGAEFLRVHANAVFKIGDALSLPQVARVERILLAVEALKDRLQVAEAGNAILRQQAEALHLVGHELGLPAGTDVVRDVLPKVKHLVMVRNLLTRGPMPGYVTMTVATERDGVPFTTLKVVSKAKAASERTYSEFRNAAIEFQHLASQAFVEADNFLNTGGAQ